MQERAEALRGIFWISVKDTFGLWDNKGSVGVRKGFKVAWREKEEAPRGLSDFIRRLMED